MIHRNKITTQFKKSFTFLLLSLPYALHCTEEPFFQKKLIEAQDMLSRVEKQVAIESNSLTVLELVNLANTAKLKCLEITTEEDYETYKNLLSIIEIFKQESEGVFEDSNIQLEKEPYTDQFFQTSSGIALNIKECFFMTPWGRIGAKNWFHLQSENRGRSFENFFNKIKQRMTFDPEKIYIYYPKVGYGAELTHIATVGEKECMKPTIPERRSKAKKWDDAMFGWNAVTTLHKANTLLQQLSEEHTV